MKIIELTNNKNINDFNNYYDRNNSTDKIQIVAFLANWCGFCEQFKPEWQKFKNMAKNKLINGVIATASDKSMGSLKCNNKINGFPTIRIFKNGKHMDYNGERDSKHLTNYVKNLESKSSMPYFKSCKKKTMKDRPKIKIKISQKSVPIENDIIDLSEKNSESEVDTLQTDEEKIKTAKKKIQDHIVLKLKELSKKAKRNVAIKKLKQQFETINGTEKMDSLQEETDNEVIQQKKTKKRKKRKKTRKPVKKKYKKKKGKKRKKKKKKKKQKNKIKKIKRKRLKKKRSRAKGFKEWSEFRED